ncbi:MAG: phospho-N-acetylmuramoyl-pentapeptide-transferase [Chitinispirillaceae bacterium]|nr:phospho-N-acetylmuramoyl-pentapeptide-transferase [Chitinispirillaceae bacterium]
MLIEFLYNTTSIYLFNSRLFSTAVATVISFLLSILLFPPYIRLLKKLQLSSELEANGRKNDPVMPAGILFLIVICITTLITVRFNSYVTYGVIIYVFFSILGAIDDIAKVINKRRVQQGKLSKQDYQYKADGISSSVRLFLYLLISALVAIFSYKYIPNISGYQSVPFFSIVKKFPYLPFWLFIPLMTLTIAVLANGVNFTDGIDTLATVPSITSLIFLGIISFVSSNSSWSNYLLIPHIYGLQELLPLIGAVCGTLLAFLWFNSPPSTIIMGDSGAVGLGGFIGILSIFTKTVFFLPVVGFIFIIEFLSVIIQIGYFKMTKKRVFLMAPIHHHFQIKMQRSGKYGNLFEIRAKIMWRFHIISVIMLVLGLVLFLKVR